MVRSISASLVGCRREKWKLYSLFNRKRHQINEKFTSKQQNWIAKSYLTTQHPSMEIIIMITLIKQKKESV